MPGNRRAAKVWQLFVIQLDARLDTIRQAAQTGPENDRDFRWRGPEAADHVRGLFRASFAEGADISTEATVRAVLAPLTADADQVLRDTQLQTTKDALRARGTLALERGIFGAPTFFADDAFFWGDDRLEDALASWR